MSIQVGNYHAEGPFRNAASLHARSGVYVILGRPTILTPWQVVDIGEAGDLQQRVSCHDRKMCWAGQGHAELAVAAIYSDEHNRMLIERQLRHQYNPPCGLM